jgi:hypothetical protein
MGRYGKIREIFFCIMGVCKLSSQAVSTNDLRCKYNKCFRFVKVNSAIPLYVIEIKWLYPILRKIMAWRTALSFRYYRSPCIYFLCCRKSERYYYLTTNISTCHVYIATLTYTLMAKCVQPFHLIDQYSRGSDLTSQWCSYNILVLVANIQRHACATMINN